MEFILECPPPIPRRLLTEDGGKCERGGLWLGRHRHRTRPSIQIPLPKQSHQIIDNCPVRPFALGTQPSRQPASQPGWRRYIPLSLESASRRKAMARPITKPPDRPWRQCLIHPNEAPESGVVSYPEPERVRCLKLRQPLSHTNVRPVRRRPPGETGGLSRLRNPLGRLALDVGSLRKGEP